MTTPSTATSIRYQQMQRDRVYRRLMDCPEQQAEAIARHYVAHAQMARAAFDLIQKTKFDPVLNPDTGYFISMMIATIKAGHARDLGIDLEWPQPEDL